MKRLAPSHTASEKCVGRGRKWLSALPSGQSQSGRQDWREPWGYKSAGLGGGLNVGAEGEGELHVGSSRAPTPHVFNQRLKGAQPILVSASLLLCLLFACSRGRQDTRLSRGRSRSQPNSLLNVISVFIGGISESLARTPAECIWHQGCLFTRVPVEMARLDLHPAKTSACSPFPPGLVEACTEGTHSLTRLTRPGRSGPTHLPGLLFTTKDSELTHFQREARELLPYNQSQNN